MKSDWQQSMRDSFKDSRELSSFLNIEIPNVSYPLFIPKDYAHLIKKSEALQKQFLPVIEEDNEDGEIDPIGDEVHFKTKRLIHRYKNRALFIPTEICPILCRYCFRKNELGKNNDMFKPEEEIELKKYLLDHPEIEEIIFTGGDPLILSNQKLEKYLNFFSSIDHIKMIRFHTRTPVILPSRVDDGLIKLIEKYSRVFTHITLVIHSNHVDEWSEEFKKSCEKLSKTRIQLLSQSVLLKGVNDNVSDLRDLFYGLSSLGIRPYYLHHPDKARGAMHFYLSKEVGLNIYAKLKSEVSGWALPHYVCETPEGQGKILTTNSLHH
jgi:lysine 2,3-aminomutase